MPCPIPLRIPLFLSLLALTGNAFSYEKSADVELPFIQKSSHVEVSLDRLVSPLGEKERYEAIRDDAAMGIQVTEAEGRIAPGARELKYTLSSAAKAPLFVKLSIRAKIPLENAAWWNGYANQISGRFEGENLLSSWFPVNAAIGRESAFLIGLNPREVYSRVESRNAPDGTLSIEIPLVLDPATSRTVSFVVSACKARYGYRDVVQHYYDLFPEDFQPAPGIHPSVLSSQARYLFWKPEGYRQKISDDMIRRYTGGAGAWEWCYGGMLRAGDWAISDEYSVGFLNNTKEQVEARRAELKTRYAKAARLDVAAMHYLNVFWAEKTLMENDFPEAMAKTGEAKSFGYQCIYGLYPWKNRYGDLFVKSIENIAKEYPLSRGIGWDSCFGHLRIPDSVAGVRETAEKSFQDGKVFALNGVAYTHLLDLNRSLKSDGYRRANAVNLKLVAPYFIGVRSDAALYEGTPVEDPRRLIRFELLRARLGSPKALTWHKHLVPSRLRWVDWKALTDEEALEAYRQLHDDALLLSYYWGSIPSPGMPTLGIQRTFEAVPELISLARQGWEPSPGVDHPESLLAARYGKGAGARLAIINPGFDAQSAALFLPAGYWEGKAPFLVRCDGKPLHYTVTPEGARLVLETPRRSVTMLEVLGQGLPDKPGMGAVELDSSGETEPGHPAKWRFAVKTASPIVWKSRFAIGEEYASASAGSDAKFANRVLELTLDSNRWTSPNRANGELVISATPAISSNVTISQLKTMEWFPKGDRKGVAIVADEKSTGEEAQRVASWFEAYSGARLDTAFVPEMAAQPGGEGLKLVLESRPGVAGTGSIEARDGSLVIAAAAPRDLKKTVLFFLRMMDQAFPDYGVIPPKEDAELERIKLLGSVLTPEPKTGFVLRPTLSERMKKAFPPLENGK